MNTIFKNMRIAFGFVYFLFNAALLTTIVFLVVFSQGDESADSGAVLLIFPILGLFAGYWVRHAQFGWWRVALIALSLLCTAAAIYFGFFMPAALH